MSNPHPLDILFLTNFSDCCFRSIPAVAQLADTLKVRLTIMHVYDPARTSKALAERKTQSFFPEADRYSACHRLTVPGTLVEVVRRHLEVWPVNLIVAPASDMIGFPQLGKGSLRAALLEQCGVPIWTIGRKLDLSRLPRPIRNVACWLDFESIQTNHLNFAAEFARSMGAKLHVMRALPHMSEGLLSHPDEEVQYLHPKLAMKQLREICGAVSLIPEIRLGVGGNMSQVNKLLAEAEADIAFFGREESLLSEWFGLGLRQADAAPCPAIYINDQVSVPMWNLESGLALPLGSSSKAEMYATRDEELVGSGGPSRLGRTTSLLSQIGLL